MQGRVIRKKAEGIFIAQFPIHKESNISTDPDEDKSYTLKNLSIGAYGKLEKKKWLIEKRIEEIDKALFNHELAVRVELGK
jgi:hypothetical protein